MNNLVKLCTFSFLTIYLQLFCMHCLSYFSDCITLFLITGPNLTLVSVSILSISMHVFLRSLLPMPLFWNQTAIQFCVFLQTGLALLKNASVLCSQTWRPDMCVLICSMLSMSLNLDFQLTYSLGLVILSSVIQSP